MSVYLFDMKGEVVAFKRSWTDDHVFDAHGHWIGWFPWEDNDAVDRDGHYLGTVVDDRLVRRNDWYERPCCEVPDHPQDARPSGSPLEPHDFPNCFAYEDVRISQMS